MNPPRRSPTRMQPNREPAARKPRVALLLATAFGLGYLPKVPGTWGSLGGVALAWGLARLLPQGSSWHLSLVNPYLIVGYSQIASAVALMIALLGVWAAGSTASFLGMPDPQTVVVDEVSGQHLTLLAGLGWSAAVNWKYLLLGLILFRVFDIWKPFPVRQAESLPGGWGIMADDWLAAVYAALGLWLARALGL